MEQKMNAELVDNLIINGETHFHVDGFLKRQNDRIWGSENPRLFDEKQSFPNGSVFGECCGLEEPSNHFPLKMRLVMHEQ